MTDLLGVNPLDPRWDSGRRRGGLRGAGSPRCPRRRPARGPRRCPGRPRLRHRRRHPRPAQCCRHPHRGHRIWRELVARPTHRQLRGTTMAGNSQRRGAIRKGSSKKGHRRLRRPAPARARGKGPTPKAADRPQHKAHKMAKAAAKRGGTGRPADRRAAAARAVGPRDRARSWRGATRSSRRCAPRSLTTMYVAGRIDADDRPRGPEATERGCHPRDPARRADRLTDGAVHRGLALQVPPYEYAHPSDLIDPEAPGIRSVVALDGITDPRNLGAIIRSVAAFGHGVVVTERRSVGMTASAWKTSAGAAARVPVALAPNLTRTLEDYRKAGFFVLGLDMDGDVALPDLEARDRAAGHRGGLGGQGPVPPGARDLRPDRLDPHVVGSSPQRRHRHRRDALRDRPPARPLTRPSSAAAASACSERPGPAPRAGPSPRNVLLHAHDNGLHDLVGEGLPLAVPERPQPADVERQAVETWARSRTNAMPVPIGWPVSSPTSVMPTIFRPMVWPLPPLIQRFQTEDEEADVPDAGDDEAGRLPPSRHRSRDRSWRRMRPWPCRYR